jgi:hypothetical protein
MPATIAEKISETEVKITTTSERIVKIEDLEKYEGQILRAKAQLEQQYQQRVAQLNTQLIAAQEQLAEGRKALGVKIEEVEPS